MKLSSFTGMRPKQQVHTSTPLRCRPAGSFYALPLACAWIGLGMMPLPAKALPPRPQPLAQQPQSSKLPPTQPTALPANPTASAQGPACAPPTVCNLQVPAPPATGVTRPHRAQVTFAGGQLTIVANDSSLHQILRSVADRTGMKITGGIADQRVFGTYGPADPSEILGTLLDGTGVNMLLKDGANHVPLELVLTQRADGSTPTPITPADGDIGAEDPVAPAEAYQPPAPAQPTQPTQPVQQSASPQQQTPSGPPSIPQPANNVLGSPLNQTPTASQIPTTNSVPLDAIPTPSTTVQTQQGIVDTPNPPPPGSSVPTADSVYQQLLQLQKAKAAAAAGTPPASPAPSAPPQ